MNIKSSLSPLFVFTIIIFTALLVSIVSFKFLPSSTVEFLNPESLAFFCINLFTYLFIFNLSLVFLSFKEVEQKKEEKIILNEKMSQLESKRNWQSISEILEEKSHHSLLNEFKLHDLRTRPYMGGKIIHTSVKKLFKFSKILSIYHKVYNIMTSIHDDKKHTDDLATFLKKLIMNLQTYQLEISLKIIHRLLAKYIVFMLISLSFFTVIGFVIDDDSIFKVNLFVLCVIFILLFVSFIYFHLKKKVYTEFLLPTSYFSHYLNKFIFVTVAFLFSITLILTLKETVLTSTGDFHHYANLAYTFGELLLPSSFESLLSSKSCKHDAFSILIYKLVFIFILSYILFTFINFAIKKYDSMYFSNIKKTLMPPELATLSIKFLLLILFLSLIYGTFFNYIHVVNIEVIPTEVNASLPSIASAESSSGDMSDYIPFSIFIAIIGGLLTMATKDLLENYFAGLSLQMDAPYEEHDRIKINNSEMLEVKHIGIRADTFYGIKSNAEIIIPHQKIIRETIVNYTLPTLDYREEISIHIPHVDTLSEEEHRSIPKRAEMLLLLAAYVNTGVKIPMLKGLDIEEEINSFRAIANIYKDKQIVKKRTSEQKKEDVITYDEYESLVGKEANCIEKIWIKLKASSTSYEREKTHHPLAKLFIHNLVETVESAITDTDETHEEEERKNIKKIKSIVASIILSLDDYQKQETILHHHIDKNFAIRKYRMFRNSHKPKDKNILQNMANELVHINYYYFILADSLWKLKNLQNSLYRKREVDSTSLEILDVPRVTTEHIYSGEGKINYWKVTLNITLELAEQSDEIIHHINMYVDNLWNDFNLPKYYEGDLGLSTKCE